MSTNSILVWAAGGPEPPDPDYDEDALLAAVTEHHLEVRLEHRLATGRPPWATPALVERAAASADEARSLSRRQLAALAEALAETAGASRPLMVKGAAWKVLTGREHMVKRSSDLDLFARDAAALLYRLVDLGYVVDAKDPPEPFGRRVAHEFAKLSRDDVNIDLHRAFPAWGYPEAVATPAATSASANPGSWACVDSVLPGRLETASLFAEAVERPGPGGAAVAVCGPEMTAVVSSCHLFANYLTEFPKPYGTIRLCELANVAELMAAHDFDWERFERLTTRHGAADAVAYTLALAGRWLGAPRTPPAGARLAGEPVPPRSLWFARGEGTFLVSTGAVESPEDVLVRSTSTAALVRHLGGVPVPAANGDRTWHTALPGAAGVPLGRSLVHHAGGEPFGLRFSVRPDPDGLAFLVETPEPGGAQVDILFYFGRAIVECIEHTSGERYAYDRTIERRIDPARLTFRRQPAGDAGRARYAVTIPWARVPAGGGAAELPLLLGVRRWHAGGEYPLAGTLVPLLLELRP